MAGWRSAWRGMGWLLSGLVAVLDHLKPVRISILLLLAAAAAVLGVPQVAELFLIALWSDPQPQRYAWLLASSAVAGLAVWYGARNAYRLRYPRWPSLQRPELASLRAWLPRVLGAAVPSLVLLGYWVAVGAVPQGQCGSAFECHRRDGRAFGLLLETLLLVAFFIGRRRLLNRLFGRHRPCIAARPALEPRAARWRDLPARACHLYGLALSLNVLATVFVVWRPGWFDGIGPLAILLLAVGCFSLSGGFFSMLVDRRGLPLLSGLLLVCLWLQSSRGNDNHQVRQYPAMTTHQAAPAAATDRRVAFADYAQAWLRQRCVPAHACPVILLSAEGGGIRAAAWTALVLAELDRRLRERAGAGLAADAAGLGHEAFAASGVSGGSLGLASYLALARTPSRREPLGQRAQRMLGEDFLAPTLANAFFVDFTQRWLPGAWFDDRGRALSRAWERAAAGAGADLAGPLAARYVDARGLPRVDQPALFLNSTTVAQGRRFVQHPFRPLSQPDRQPWTAAFDGSAFLDPRTPLSEAVLNSARFTYISPAGSLVSAFPDSSLPSELQLVDGGYFENSAATTALELLRLLRRAAAQLDQPIRVLVVHISSDPQLGDFVSQHDSRQPWPLYSPLCPMAGALPPTRWRGELLAPADALLDARMARGDFARQQLLGALHLDAVEGDALWHFRLCPGDYPLPLGWTISTPVFAEMTRQLDRHYPLDALIEQVRRMRLSARGGD